MAVRNAHYSTAASDLVYPRFLRTLAPHTVCNGKQILCSCLPFLQSILPSPYVITVAGSCLHHFASSFVSIFIRALLLTTSYYVRGWTRALRRKRAGSLFRLDLLVHPCLRVASGIHIFVHFLAASIDDPGRAMQAGIDNRELRPTRPLAYPDNGPPPNTPFPGP